MRNPNFFQPKAAIDKSMVLGKAQSLRKIGKVEFNDMKLDVKLIEFFVEQVINNLPRGKKIKIGFKNTIVNYDIMSTLEGLFQYVDCFDFKYTNLSSESIKLLAHHLKLNNYITTIHLEGNIIDPETYCTFLDAVKKNTHVNKIFLNNTRNYAKYNEEYYKVDIKLRELFSENCRVEVLTLNSNYKRLNHFNHLLSNVIQSLDTNSGLREISFGKFNLADFYNNDMTTLKKLLHDLKFAINKQSFITKIDYGLMNTDNVNPALKASLERVNVAVINNRRTMEQFFKLVSLGNLVEVKNMLQRSVVHPHACHPRTGYNALHYAVMSKRNSNSMIEMLYQFNFVNLLLKRSYSCTGSNTPLHLALFANNLAAVQTLLENLNENTRVRALNESNSEGVVPQQIYCRIK